MMSRRAAEELISKGKVTVNGNTAFLGSKADPDHDVIRINGKKLPGKNENVYVMLNKPSGYVTTLSDEKGRKTVAELVERVGVRLYPVGRLDLNSDGLLLMTNDGELANILMHPSGGIQKKYKLTVLCEEGEDLPKALEKLTEPIEIDGKATSPAEISDVRIKDRKAVLFVTIHEGRNRQIRRLCENSGLKVLRLTRVAEGPIELGKLESGSFRYLTEEEIASLKKSAGMAETEKEKLLKSSHKGDRD